MSKQTLELVKQSIPEFQALIALNASKDADVATMAMQEIDFFRQQAQFNPAYLECHPTSIIMAIKSVIRKNLTLDPSAGLVYIKTRQITVKDENGQDRKVKALEIMESANGLISYSRQCGTILDVERPEIKKDDQGKVIAVIFKCLVPSFNEAGKPITRWRTVEFDESDFLRWRKASHKENARWKQAHEIDNVKLNWANENYTSWQGGIDPEFARAKAIRHGLKKLGTNPHESNRKRQQPVTEDINHEIVVDSAKDFAASGDEIHAFDNADPAGQGTGKAGQQDDQPSGQATMAGKANSDAENNIENLETINL